MSQFGNRILKRERERRDKERERMKLIREQIESEERTWRELKEMTVKSGHIFEGTHGLGFGGLSKCKICDKSLNELLEMSAPGSGMLPKCKDGTSGMIIVQGKVKQDGS